MTSNLQIQELNSCFGFLDALIDSMRRGSGDTAEVPDSPNHNTGLIMTHLAKDLALGQEECYKLFKPMRMLTTLLENQIVTRQSIEQKKAHGSLEQLVDLFHALDHQKPHEYDKDLEVSVTRYNGNACPYVVLPHDAPIDYQRLQRDADELKALFREVPMPADNPTPAIRRGVAHAFGPYTPQQASLAAEVLPVLLAFHGMDRCHCYSHAIPGKEKTFLIVDSPDVGGVLRKERLDLRNRHVS